MHSKATGSTLHKHILRITFVLVANLTRPVGHGACVIIRQLDLRARACGCTSMCACVLACVRVRARQHGHTRARMHGVRVAIRTRTRTRGFRPSRGTHAWVPAGSRNPRTRGAWLRGSHSSEPTRFWGFMLLHAGRQSEVLSVLGVSPARCRLAQT